jgi:hypothetical protein
MHWFRSAAPAAHFDSGGRRSRRNGVVWQVTSVVLLAVIAALPARAHHSFSMFDMDRKVSFTGVVAEVQWTNPHVWVEVDVPGEDGETIRHGVEFTSRVHLTRRGFTRTTVNPGDRVTFVVSPYHDGRPGGRFWTVTLPTGEIVRDPGAQRAYERAEREAAAE